MKLKNCIFLLLFCSLLISVSCNRDEETITIRTEWVRSASNPVLRDVIPAESYEIASDPHVFFDESEKLQMVYTGDTNGISSIKLASGMTWSNWDKISSLLDAPSPSGLDTYKETAFYRKSLDGKHQIYYIGYEDEDTFEAQIFLAEADELEGPYTQIAEPMVPKGNIAGKEVYLMTSPSVVEHEGLLYMTFIGWNAHPDEVSEIWIMGASSIDDGRTWLNLQLVDTPIGVEGQVTKKSDGTFVAVRTGGHNDKEAIFYAKANHPFGPWTAQSEPILSQTDMVLEKDEIIAPQLTFDPQTNEPYLFYTGADHLKGWWIMLATKP